MQDEENEESSKPNQELSHDLGVPGQDQGQALDQGQAQGTT